MWINSELSVSDEITQKTQNRHGYQNVRIRKPRSKTMISTEYYCVQVSKSLFSNQFSIGRPRMRKMDVRLKMDGLRPILHRCWLLMLKTKCVDDMLVTVFHEHPLVTNIYLA